MRVMPWGEGGVRVMPWDEGGVRVVPWGEGGVRVMPCASYAGGLPALCLMQECYLPLCLICRSATCPVPHMQEGYLPCPHAGGLPALCSG